MISNVLFSFRTIPKALNRPSYSTLFNAYDKLPSFQSSQLSVVLAPFGFGQKKAGVSRGPEALASAGLFEAIKNIPTPSHSVPLTGPRPSLWGDPHVRSIEPEFRGLNLPAPTTSSGGVHQPLHVGTAARLLYGAVAEEARRSRFVLTLGGDHSLALGSVAGTMSQHPSMGLIWVDAHADINTAATSPSGSLHGCPVSFLLGLDRSAAVPGFEWTNDFVPLQPSRVAYIGLRDVDYAERALLRQLNITCFSMSDIVALGFSRVVQEAVRAIDPTATQPIHCSFDIDALDPQYAASTGTPVPGGISLAEGKYLAESLARTGRLVGFDLMEVNPDLADAEKQKTTIQSAKEIILSGLGSTFLN